MRRRVTFYLVHAFHFGRIMWVVGVDGKREYERATLVHPLWLLLECTRQMRNFTFIWRDGQGEVEEIGRIWEMRFHRWGEVQLS
jgi:hypothetical protein